MAKVSELKERARAYEKEGEHEKALKIYLHVLSHLEGSPAIKRELPMYVKAGDLQIRLEDTAGAIASYEKAAEQYAEHGSAKSVIALAAKVLRVDPMKADFHLVHTRALIDHGHIAAARDVLADYADRSGLEKTQEALRALEGQEDHNARPLLEMILDSAERGERASTEETAKRVSVQLGALVTLDDPPAEEEADTEQPVGEDREEEEEQGEDEEDEEDEEEEESEELESKPVFDPRSMFETVERLSTIEAPPLDLGGGLLSSDGESLVEHGTPPPLDDGPAPPEPIAPPQEAEPVAPPPTPEPVSSGPKESGGGDLTFEPDGSAFAAQPVGPKSDPVRPRSDPFMPPSDPPPRRAHAARAPSGVLTQRSDKKGIPVWVWGAAGVVVIGGGVVFVMMRSGGETAPTIPPAIVDTTPPPQPVATVDTSALGLTVDSAVLDPNDSLALALGGSLDSLTAGDSALLDSIRVPAGSLAVGDSATGGPATDTTGPPVVAPAPATAGPAYIIDGSTVQDVVQYSRQGRSGWRTIQTLSTGERVTVETTMANVNDPNEMDQGATNVTSDADGSVGTTRIDNLIVTVTGSVSEASMRELLTLLAEHNQ